MNLKQLKSLTEKATPGPWERHPNKRFWVLLPGPEEHEYLEAEHDANAEFCAASRTALPELIAWVERAREWLQLLECNADSEERRQIRLLLAEVEEPK